MKKGYLIEKNGSHYSFITKEGGLGYNQSVKLFHSKIGQWTSLVKGKLASRLECDGNGYKVYFREGKSFYLDYCQLSELRQMLNLIDRGMKKNTFCEYKIVGKK